MKKQTKKLKTTARSFFRKIKGISSPAFPKEKIIFNSKGLSHLFYKGSHKKSGRSDKETQARVSLLPRAVKILKLMPLAQEENTFMIEGKKIKYWAFEAVVDNRRIKVIVRQIGQGKKHFWSVIPAWRKTRGRVVNSKNDLRKE